jgi:uncharacterized protein DUF4288
MWFSARLLYRSIVDDSSDVPPLYEESIILIDAENEEAARAEAERIAVSREHSYPNAEGKLVRWKFVRVLESQDLCEEELSSGVEVYSRLFRSESEPE